MPQVKVPYRSGSVGHAFHLYVIQVPDRKGLYDFLHEAGIYAQVHYVPLNTMPYYRHRYPGAGALPVSRSITGIA